MRPDPSLTTVFVVAAVIVVGVVILALIWPLANKLFFSIGRRCMSGSRHGARCAASTSGG